MSDLILSIILLYWPVAQIGLCREEVPFDMPIHKCYVPFYPDAPSTIKIIIILLLLFNKKNTIYSYLQMPAEETC